MSRRRTGHERNVDGLRAASARKHEEAERKVDNAIRGLLRAGEPITFRRVATVARVSSGWLYAQPDVKERITHLRGQPADKAGPPAERASDASKDAIVRALRQRGGTLDDDCGDYSPASNNSRSGSKCSTASCMPSGVKNHMPLPTTNRPCRFNSP